MSLYSVFDETNQCKSEIEIMFGNDRSAFVRVGSKVYAVTSQLTDRLDIVSMNMPQVQECLLAEATMILVNKTKPNNGEFEFVRDEEDADKYVLTKYGQKVKKRRRIIRLIVLGAALAGFIGAAIYGYFSGNRSVMWGSLVVAFVPAILLAAHIDTALKGHDKTQNEDIKND